MISTASDRQLRMLGRILNAAAILSAPVTLGLLLTAGQLRNAVESYALVNVLAGVTFGSLGWLLVSADLHNRLTWLVTGFGVCLALPGVAAGVSQATDVHSSLSPLLSIVYNLWVFGAFGIPTFGLLLTPDGKYHGPRWKRLGAISAVVMIVLYITFVAQLWRDVSIDQVDSDSPLTSVQNVAFSVFSLCALGSLASLVIRYRQSGPAIRRRLRWVVLGGVVAVLAGIASWSASALGVAFLTFGFPFFAFCYGMAIWRDQLFDVDVVVSRTILFGFLAAFIGLVYVSVVYGIGSLIGSFGGGDWLALVATVVVAVAFQPARARLERAANRLVYGSRATPYEVLAGLTARMGRTDSSELVWEQLAERLAAGTGATHTVIWRASQNGSFVPLGSWSISGSSYGLPTDNIPAEELPTASVLIESSGDTLGALSVEKRQGEELHSSEAQLIKDLAGSAALLMEKERLDDALLRQREEIYDSRKALLSAQDTERQRLEEQLSRGTQQRLRSLKTELSRAAQTARDEHAELIGGQLDALTSQTQIALDEITALAQGLFPPLLESEGVGSALRNFVTNSPFPVLIESSLKCRFDIDDELAVYFSVAEALTNAAKYSEANAVDVELAEHDGALTFVVRDDGVGFAAESMMAGVGTGLTGIRDRLEAVGGSLEVISQPGNGTEVRGTTAARQLAKVS